MLQVGKWHQLLHSKYSKTKAELRLALYLDEDPQSQQAASAPLVHAGKIFSFGVVSAHDSMFITAIAVCMELQLVDNETPQMC